MSRRKGQPTPDLPLFDFPLDGSDDDQPARQRPRPEAPEDEAAAPKPAPSSLTIDPALAPDLSRADVADLPLTPLPVAKPAPVKPAETAPTSPAHPEARQPSLFDPLPATATPEDEGEGSTPTVADPTLAAAAGQDEAHDAPFRARVLAGLADFALHLAMVGAMIGAATVLGVTVGWRDWPALGLLVIAFSFLYWVVPLAFWGQTPGMAWIGIGSRALDDEPLSFAQTALRWLGALLTVLFAGLPLALAATGSSLSDRLSQSKTHQV